VVEIISTDCKTELRFISLWLQTMPC